MDEQKTTQETQSKEAVKDSSERNDGQSSRLIEDANLAAKRLEEANEERRRLLEREEQLEAMRRLGGSTNNVDEQKKEESPQEYTKRVLSGKL